MEKRNTFISYNGKLANSDMMMNKNIPKNAVYEVIKLIDGKPLFFEDHMIRFLSSIKNMKYLTEFTNYEILQEIILLSRVNMNKNVNVQLLYIPLENKDSFDLILSLTEGLTLSPDEKEEGVAVETISIERHNPNVKSMGNSYKNRIQSSAKYKDTFELLLVNQDGYITEGSRSNVFFIKGNKIITSPAQNVLLGVTRKYIIELCQENKIEIEYCNIREQDVTSMDGAFLTGTTVDVVIIRKVNGEKFKDANKIARLLKEKYEKLMRDYLEHFEVD